MLPDATRGIVSLVDAGPGLVALVDAAGRTLAQRPQQLHVVVLVQLVAPYNTTTSLQTTTLVRDNRRRFRHDSARHSRSANVVGNLETLLFVKTSKQKKIAEVPQVLVNVNFQFLDCQFFN